MRSTLAAVILIATALVSPGRVLDASETRSAAVHYPASNSYVVVCSQKTFHLPEWRDVVDALRRKHDADAVVYNQSPWEALPTLQRIFPRYVCVVARPEEADRNLVVGVHRLTRALDTDPYTDAVWGILTGYDATDALRIARQRKPLILKRGLGGTGAMDMDAFVDAIKFDEGKPGGRTVKTAGGAVTEEADFPADSTAGLVAAMNDFRPDAFFTSGHATEKDWQIGYSYKDGQFRCEGGQLFGLDTKGTRHDINSPNPKVFLPVGNCLIGHIPDRECMALAMMHSAGVCQMFGYMAVTFHGYMGWGTGSLFVGQRDRYTLAQAFYFNNQALIHKLQTQHATKAGINLETYDRRAIAWLVQRHGLDDRDALGCVWDRDAVAFYGDPGWEVRFPPRPPAWRYTLEETKGTYVLSVTTTREGKWGDRPVMIPFPIRFGDVDAVTCSADILPVVTDNFALLPLQGAFSEGEKLNISFTAREIERKRTSATDPDILVWRHDPKTESLVNSYPEDLQRRLSLALTTAATNKAQIEAALERAPVAHREAVAFIVAHMPEHDLRNLTAEFLLRDIATAYDARARVPWGRELPEDVFMNDVLPYASLNERREDWRSHFSNVFVPLVKDCRTPGEAALKLNRDVFNRLNVRYHATKRRKPDQSPSESREIGYASCTGLSILLVDACRACAIPARIVGTPMWTGKRGNHTWVEVWDGGHWHFIGAAESQALDQGWFVADAAAADVRDPRHWIYASSFKEAECLFPLAWDPSVDYVHAENVTQRYIDFGRRSGAKAEDEQKAMEAAAE